MKIGAEYMLDEFVVDQPGRKFITSAAMEIFISLYLFFISIYLPTSNIYLFLDIYTFDYSIYLFSDIYLLALYLCVYLSTSTTVSLLQLSL